MATAVVFGYAAFAAKLSALYLALTGALDQGLSCYGVAVCLTALAAWFFIRADDARALAAEPES